MARLHILKYYLLLANIVLLMYIVWVLQTAIEGLQEDEYKVSIEVLQVFYFILLSPVFVFGFIAAYKEHALLILCYSGMLIMFIFAQSAYYMYCYVNMNYDMKSLTYCVHFGWLNLIIQITCVLASYHIQEDIEAKRVRSVGETGAELSEQKEEPQLNNP